MPGVFAQVGMEYGHKYGGTSFGAFRQKFQKKKSLSLNIKSARGLPEEVHTRGDNE